MNPVSAYRSEKKYRKNAQLMVAYMCENEMGMGPGADVKFKRPIWRDALRRMRKVAA